MRTLFVCAALTAALMPASARAQSVVLTEAQVLSQLGTESPRVRVVHASIDVARADILTAGRWPNPRVTFNRESVAGVAENMVMVAQPLPVTGRRRLEVSAATARVEASSSRAEDQIRRVRADLRVAFTDLWAAQERERELTRSRDRLNELAGILGKREAAGDAAGFDRLRAEREVVDIDTTRAMATTERARAQAILASFLTTPPGPAAIEAVRPTGTSAMLPTVDELVMRAETSRGELVALARELDAARFAEQAAGRRAIPEPEVVAGTKTSNAAGGDVGSIFSVHVAVPLFDRARPERAMAQARGQQVRAETDVLRQTIRAQITAWRAAVVERRGIAERHRAALTSGTDEIERIAQVSYEAGERGILELLDAHRTSASARVRQTELDAAVREAEIELEYVSGWEIP
ncbi:MAG TPA: TolC family protein [Vicinamibacterales bacterium]|nr:TolC family protein [Vicinamibacterales bacterium]